MINDIDVICMTSGKCGSSTLRQTFLNNGFKTIKCHSVEDFEKQFGYDGLIDLIDKSCSNKKIYLIDSYRTPIERKTSSFFENISRLYPDYKTKTAEEIIKYFNENWLEQLENYQSIDSIMEYYNVENFTEFDFKKKYVIKEKDNKVFIKILYSDIKNWGSILSEIFNKQILISSRNIGCTKPYAIKYRIFKKKYKIPISYLNIIENDKSFKIFNTEINQKKYINKWKKKSI